MLASADRLGSLLRPKAAMFLPLAVLAALAVLELRTQLLNHRVRDT
jgi:hypothetical protein